MTEEFHLFPEQYQTNVEFLELQNDDDFSGVELLKQGCANCSRGVQPCIKMVHLCHFDEME